jgi:hypothetical protein
MDRQWEPVANSLYPISMAASKMPALARASMRARNGVRACPGLRMIDLSRTVAEFACHVSSKKQSQSS